LRRSSNQDG